MIKNEMNKYQLEKLAEKILTQIINETQNADDFSFKLASLYGRFLAEIAKIKNDGSVNQ